MEQINDFLKTVDGLAYLRFMCSEYGTWDESKQCYNMPVLKAIELAHIELKIELENGIKLF